jgi:hypothetical protein
MFDKMFFSGLNKDERLTRALPGWADRDVGLGLSSGRSFLLGCPGALQYRWGILRGRGFV